MSKIVCDNEIKDGRYSDRCVHQPSVVDKCDVYVLTHVMSTC